MRHRMKRRHAYRRRGRRHIPITGGLNREKLSNPGGAPDVELVKLKYETTSAFTATGGAASYLQIKQNSVYRPYPGNTDSCGGYQRMYALFRQSYVAAAKCTVRIWSATGTSSQEPFRVILIPCTSAQYTVYSAYTNIAALQDVPHAKQVLFSPGGELPSITVYSTTGALRVGQKRLQEGDLLGSLSGTSGVDPTTLQYFIVGLQSMAGTTTLNCQIQVSMTYYVKFFEPIAVAVQQLDEHKNFWGNDDGEPVERKAPPPEEKKEDPEFELIRVPKVKTPAPAVSSKK